MEQIELGDFWGFDTPATINRTYLGNILYSTPDVQDDLQITQLEVCDLIHKDFENTPLKTLQRTNKDSLNILSPRSMSSITSKCTSTHIEIDAVNGRQKISLLDYLNRISIDSPQIVIAFSEEVIIYWILKLV
jgi:hypothetical protein